MDTGILKCDHCQDGKDPTTKFRAAPYLRRLCNSCYEGQEIRLKELETKVRKTGEDINK